METATRPYAFSRKVFCEGMRDGVPIALGYFAVSFSLGIAARKAGLTPVQGFFASLLNNASAGEYAAFALIASGATYLEVAIITLIANARYLLMSCALAQRFAPGTPFFHRLIIGYDVTDELFGITIARPGWLNPFYTYGAIALAAPAWAAGTACGIIAGNLLPLRAVSALSVALYGMFLAIIIPPALKSKVVAALVHRGDDGRAAAHGSLEQEGAVVCPGQSQQLCAVGGHHLLVGGADAPAALEAGLDVGVGEAGAADGFDDDLHLRVFQNGIEVLDKQDRKSVV